MNTVDAWGKRMAMAFASRTGDGHGFRPAAGAATGRDAVDRT